MIKKTISKRNIQQTAYVKLFETTANNLLATRGKVLIFFSLKNTHELYILLLSH